MYIKVNTKSCLTMTGLSDSTRTVFLDGQRSAGISLIHQQTSNLTFESETGKIVIAETGYRSFFFHFEIVLTQKKHRASSIAIPILPSYPSQDGWILYI